MEQRLPIWRHLRRHRDRGRRQRQVRVRQQLQRVAVREQGGLRRVRLQGGQARGRFEEIFQRHRGDHAPAARHVLPRVQFGGRPLQQWHEGRDRGPRAEVTEL